jgi:hypothetical protein
MENKDEFLFLVDITKIHISLNIQVLSLDVAIGYESVPIIEILDVIVEGLDNITEIKMPINFNPLSFREAPSIEFQHARDSIYFKQHILKQLKNYPFVLKFFEEEEITTND